MTVPMSRPSSTAPPGWRAKRFWRWSKAARTRVGRHDRGELADRVLAQRGVVEQAFVEIAGGDGIGLDRRVQLHPLHGQRDGA